MFVEPAPAGYGIVFKRSDLQNTPTIQAHFSKVINTFMCTQLGENSEITVATIEHIMAALVACGVDNALINIWMEAVYLLLKR
jgi:UDP-3-O-[3-hydroxymyristoyl] N-acetylglucosamine deacetylase